MVQRPITTHRWRTLTQRQLRLRDVSWYRFPMSAKQSEPKFGQRSSCRPRPCATRLFHGSHSKRRRHRCATSMAVRIQRRKSPHLETTTLELRSVRVAFQYDDSFRFNDGSQLIDGKPSPRTTRKHVFEDGFPMSAMLSDPSERGSTKNHWFTH